MINDNHRTLLHQTADAIARTDHPTSASLHPLLEDYLPHARAALEVLTGHLDALEIEADRNFSDDPWDHGYYGALNDIRESTRELTGYPETEEADRFDCRSYRADIAKNIAETASELDTADSHEGEDGLQKAILAMNDALLRIQKRVRDTDTLSPADCREAIFGVDASLARVRLLLWPE